MAGGCNLLRSLFSTRQSVIRAACTALLLASSIGVSTARALTLQGTVESNGTGLAKYRVALYAAIPGGSGSDWQRLGVATTDASGHFQINYEATSGGQSQIQPALFVEATSGSAMLASAVGSLGDAPSTVVVNERTTVATGTSFAQFVHGSAIEGNTYGVLNAVRMAANLADPKTGNVGVVLAASPNGTETSTLATFNSLANVVASCVAAASDCTLLFDATTPPGGAAPSSVLEALANIAKNPSFVAADGSLASDDPLFDLAQSRPEYSPALSEPPTNWLLFLRFTGGFYSAQDSNNLMNGPGNFAIDERGFSWLIANYQPEAPDQYACAGRRLIKFYPWGANYRTSPYFGGGLSGAGYGIAFDPNGNLWVGNFGFQTPPCLSLPQAAKNDSVSLFRPDGTALSPPTGFKQGNISWPQGTVSDRKGNIWVANCGNDSVTKIPGGDPDQAFNILLGAKPAAGQPQIKPFGATLDTDGNLWVANNRNNTVSVISPEGQLIDTLPASYQGKTVLTRPMGDAADSKGNVWVANSDWVDVPCPTQNDIGPAANPSVTLFQMGSRTPYPGSPFTGGGLTLPWGVTVDGDDTVWAFNFGAVPVGQTTSILTGISRFCGTNTSKCPAGMHVGDPISPNTGYRSNALERITAGQVDPSGNIWLTSNWKLDADPSVNPGGNSIVIAIGAAAPVKTPLIGPPVPFN